MKQLEFIFDFASPNAYLAYHALGPILEATKVELIITPCLLGGIFKATNNQAPMVAYGHIKGKMDYEMLEMQRFIVRHQLGAFKMNPHFPLNSMHAIRGLIAAQTLGVGKPYLEAVLKGFWEDGLKMDETEVIAKILTQKGLDGPALMAATADPEIKATLAANTQAAVTRGVFGIPSFFVKGELYFGKERLAQVCEALTT
ncbi:2-hydroxychromene-2-carboxylate isomerase [Candidatus Phycosocius spiralis]|uniref:2-hydroxychromene-2-carboxylate isomerase n=1 Tax=Candidatus Phycosocius spiralis TaxID=2815099 RepID=A0ABQ4PSS5_9PROT|nr:2-hydroxychromene-2-carboxylate isomerase [Candidatus Phycosocius spiralis]GIU66056.1 2-hydroxychromene-2-carboxylate isomerase [Candidatus Phycosocius spiralis]